MERTERRNRIEEITKKGAKRRTVKECEERLKLMIEEHRANRTEGRG